MNKCKLTQLSNLQLAQDYIGSLLQSELKDVSLQCSCYWPQSNVSSNIRERDKTETEIETETK